MNLSIEPENEVFMNSEHCSFDQQKDLINQNQQFGKTQSNN